MIDLSGDLRLPDAAAYKQWYGHDHPAPALLGHVPYGLHRALPRPHARGAAHLEPGLLRHVRRSLPLVPLAARGPDRRRSDMVVDAKSGATGAGRTLREDLLFCEVADDFSAYSPGRSHRHVGEMEAVLRGARPAARCR